LRRMKINLYFSIHKDVNGRVASSSSSSSNNNDDMNKSVTTNKTQRSQVRSKENSELTSDNDVKIAGNESFKIPRLLVNNWEPQLEPRLH
jgi:transposase-like protein